MQDAYRIGLERQAIYPRLGRDEERSARLSVRIFTGFVTFRLFGQPGRVCWRILSTSVADANPGAVASPCGSPSDITFSAAELGAPHEPDELRDRRSNRLVHRATSSLFFDSPKSSERPFIVTITKTGFSGTLCP